MENQNHRMSVVVVVVVVVVSAAAAAAAAVFRCSDAVLGKTFSGLC